MPQSWREDATGGEPGAEDDEQEAGDDSGVKRFAEQDDAQEDRDDRVDVGEDGAATGSNLGHEREEGQVGQRGAYQAKH